MYLGPWSFVWHQTVGLLCCWRHTCCRALSWTEVGRSCCAPEEHLISWVASESPPSWFPGGSPAVSPCLPPRIGPALTAGSSIPPGPLFGCRCWEVYSCRSQWKPPDSNTSGTGMSWSSAFSNQTLFKPMTELAHTSPSSWRHYGLENRLWDGKVWKQRFPMQGPQSWGSLPCSQSKQGDLCQPK